MKSIVSVLWLTGGVAGRFGDLQVGGRGHLLIVPPHCPHVEQLALLDQDETEHDQHDSAHRGEEADQHPLYDALVQPSLLPGPGGGVEVAGGGEGGVGPLQPVAATRITSRLMVRRVGVGDLKTELWP